MAQLWRIWLGSTKLELSNELSYRFNFILKTIAVLLTSIIVPIISLLIYTISSGIPGWSLEEFLLMNGTFLFVGGLAETFFNSMTWRTITTVWRGNYDIHLIRPVRPLVSASLETFNPDGVPTIFVGAAIITAALLKLNLAFNITNFLLYFLIIGLALVFMYAINVAIIALSFVFLKTWALANAFEDIMGLGKYPLTIYGSMGMLAFTLLFPVGLAAFYPAQAILGQLSMLMIGKLALVAFAFLGFSLLVWSLWIKKYTSAGG